MEWGSAEATTWAWEQDVRGAEKLVLLALANGVSDGEDVKRLAATTGMTQKDVRAALDHLHRRGLLSELMRRRWGR